MEKNIVKMKLSIIIPVYNSEKYLVKCLESVCNQNMPKTEYEIIIVNDGSKDSSKEIILHFKEKFSNVIFIDQDNKGVSSARNVAINLAVGEYITFVDSDDQIENTLQIILDKIKINDLDIFYPAIETYDENEEKISNIIFPGSENYVKKGLSQERRTFTSTFYRKKTIRTLRFNEGISFGEDTVFNAQVQALAARVAYSKIPYYKYTVRKDSLSKQGQSLKSFEGFLAALQEIYIFHQLNFRDSDEAKIYFDKVYEIFVTRALELSVIPEWNHFRYKRLIELLREKNLLYVLNSFSVKYPFAAESFLLFKAYQKYLNMKSHVYKLICPV